MKFAEKIIWSCLIILSILFSIGSSVLIYQNHHNLLQSTLKHNLSTHEIEVYSLETRLFQDSLEYSMSFGQDQSKMMNKAIYYLEQFRYTSQTKKTYGLSLPDKSIFYSNIDSQFSQYISVDYNQKYFIKHKDHQYKMFITSKINTGKDIYYLTSCYDMTSVYQDRDRQIINFLIISIILYTVAYTILRFLSSYLTQSIHKLNAVTKRIANGDYSERTCIKSDDEIGELSKSFDEMAEMNEKKIHQLEESVIQKEEFMGSFSHEVKTPMTTILGFADLLRTCDCDIKTRQKAAQYIYTEGKRLEKLSYTLMDLLSLSDQQIQLIPVNFQTIIKQLKEDYDKKDINCLLKFGSCDQWVKSQPELLFTLLRNLIDNAIKASKEGQTISLQTSVQDGYMKVSIIDEGIGMNEEDVQKATEAFYMADKSRSRSLGGAGLGLTIVKRICEAHQTTLSIQSQLNVGTTISFELEVLDYEEE